MRGSTARALLPALAVLALVGVVAIAATGSTVVDWVSAGRLAVDVLGATAAAAALLAVVLVARRTREN